MGLKKTIKDTTYRIRIRKALSDSTAEQVQITLEECKRYFEIKNRKGKK